jgi:uncharacterized YigZ family protein
MLSYNTVIHKSVEIHEVKKSKFIAVLLPCDSIAFFEDALIEIKNEYPKASHYCYAYRIVESVLMEKYQDDKEPSGTAGVPILEVLKGRDLIQCALVVIRYFGGVKLGTGGLSRAYSDAAREVMSHAEILIKEEAIYLETQVDYHYCGKLDYLIASEKLALTDIIYNEKVTYKISVRVAQANRIISDLTEITSGKVSIKESKAVMGFFGENTFIEA